VGSATMFRVQLDDGADVAVTITNATSTVLDLSHVAIGVHSVMVSALDGHSKFPLRRATLVRESPTSSNFVLVTFLPPSKPDLIIDA
jgi:archaellum component FlaF (FlaF/FlaG flagellin family)